MHQRLQQLIGLEVAAVLRAESHKLSEGRLGKLNRHSLATMASQAGTRPEGFLGVEKALISPFFQQKIRSQLGKTHPARWFFCNTVIRPAIFWTAHWCCLLQVWAKTRSIDQVPRDPLPAGITAPLTMLIQGHCMLASLENTTCSPRTARIRLYK
jgi:hypothetical protein